MSAGTATGRVDDDEGEDNSPAGSLITGVLGWTLLTAVVLMAFFSAVGALNRDVYSAGGFVRTYLRMLSAHDIDGALARPGVMDGLPEKGSAAAALLNSNAMGGLSGVNIVGEENLGSGRYRVTVTYDLASNGETVHGQTEFVVRSTGQILGLLNNWGFETSPTATLQTTVQSAPSFDVGRVATESGPANSEGGYHQDGRFTVLVPGLYTLSHSSYYLYAAPSSIPVLTTGQTTRGYLNVQAKQNFVDAVQAEVNTMIAGCAAQPKLYPTGCPFGKSIDDRIVSTPTWSVRSLPSVRVIQGYGAWYVPETQGVVHLSVDVRSLFDGSVSTQSYDVPFTVSPRMKVEPGNTIELTW